MNWFEIARQINENREIKRCPVANNRKIFNSTKQKQKTFAARSLGWDILYAKNRMPMADAAGMLSQMGVGLLLFC